MAVTVGYNWDIDFDTVGKTHFLTAVFPVRNYRNSIIFNVVFCLTSGQSGLRTFECAHYVLSHPEIEICGVKSLVAVDDFQVLLVSIIVS